MSERQQHHGFGHSQRVNTYCNGDKHGYQLNPERMDAEHVLCAADAYQHDNRDEKGDDIILAYLGMYISEHPPEAQNFGYSRNAKKLEWNKDQSGQSLEWRSENRFHDAPLLRDLGACSRNSVARRRHTNEQRLRRVQE